jgi:hypothetical protein
MNRGLLGTLVLAAGALLLVGGSASASRARAGAPACTITYTAGYQPDPLDWEQAKNWSAGRLPGPSDYACIPAGISGTVSVGNGAKVEGVSVANAGGLRLHNFGLELTDPATPSTIENVDIGSLATFTVDKGVTVTLTGASGTAGLTGFGAAAIAGAGTVVVARGATLGFAVGLSGSVTVEVARGARVNLRSGYFSSATGARLVNEGTVVVSPPPSKGFVDNFGTNSTGTVVNAKGATIVDPAGAATFQFGVPFQNAGTVTVAGGQTLSFLRGATSSPGSRFAVSPHGTLLLGGGPYTFQLAHASLTGTGTFDFQLGTIVLGGQKLANVAQCATTEGPFTVTKSWISAACVSNGEAVLSDQGRGTTTTFARGARAQIGYGGYLVLDKRHTLLNAARLVDQMDICLAGGSLLRNDGTLVGIKNKDGTMRSIHPNCGLPGPTGKLLNDRGGLVQGTTGSLEIYVPFVNHGRVSGKVTIHH